MNLDAYKSTLWQKLPPTPQLQSKKLIGSTVLKICPDINKKRALVGKLYISRGSYYNPAVNLLKTSAANHLLGKTTIAGTDFIN